MSDKLEELRSQLTDEQHTILDMILAHYQEQKGTQWAHARSLRQRLGRDVVITALQRLGGNIVVKRGYVMRQGKLLPKGQVLPQGYCYRRGKYCLRVTVTESSLVLTAADVRLVCQSAIGVTGSASGSSLVGSLLPLRRANSHSYVSKLRIWLSSCTGLSLLNRRCSA